MVSVVKKFLYLLALFFLVTRVVDFSSPEFDPLRTHWETPFDHIQQYHFYGEYIQPFQDKVAPIVTNIQGDYVVPTVAKVNKACLVNYQAYISKYVSLLSNKVTDSALFNIWVENKPKLIHLYEVIALHFELVQRSATTYTAVGLIKLTEAFKYATREIIVLSRALITKSGIFYADAKPRAISFYNDSVVPSATSFSETASTAWTVSKDYAIRAYIAAKQFYLSEVHPFLEENIFSHVRSYYAQTAKVYVDIAYAHLFKYYQVLKINQALNLSKRLITGSYDQAVKYFQQEGINETETEATTAEEIDIATETSYDAMGTPEVEETETETSSDTQSSAATRQTVAVVDQDMVTDNQVLEKRASNDIEISLAQEIQTWKTYILESVDNIFNNFDSSIAEMAEIMISDVKPKLSSMLRELSETAHKDFAVVNKAIYNVNSTSVLLENGEEVEVDQTGNIIDHKVTREEMRELLADGAAKLKVLAEAINDELKAYVSDVEVAIDGEKKLIVDIYEEFAEVAINEFSKKMMYSTFSSSFDNFQNKKDDESFKDWKEYVKVKNTLIAKRDDLVNKKPQLTAVETLLAEIRETLRALDHETGSYYAILRAQANLAFQAREKEERLAAEALENGEEEAFDEDAEQETLTLKTTVIKTQTLNADGSINSDEVETEPFEEEEVSDVETDDEDFDTPVENGENVTIVDQPEAKTVVFNPEETPVTGEEEPEKVVVVDHPEARTVAFNPDDIPVAEEPSAVPEPVEESTPVPVGEEAEEADEEPADPTPQGIVEHIEEPSEEEEQEQEEETAEEQEGLEDVVEHHDDVEEEKDEVTVVVDTPEMRYASMP